MRRAAFAAVAFAGLVLAAALGLAWGLPTLVERSGLRERLDMFAQERLGRRLTYDRFEVGLLPPRVEVRGLTLAARAPAARPVFAADRASFSFSWRSLVSGQVVIDGVEVDRATLRVVRTADGVDGLGAALPAAPALPSAGEGAPSLPVSIERVSLRASRLEVVDRAVDPAVAWQLDGVEADVTSSRDAPGAAETRLLGQFSDGGALRLRGRVAASGDLDLQVDLSQIALAPLVSYVEALDRAAGTGSAALQIERVAGGPFEFDLSASSDDLDAASGQTTALGPVELTAQLRWQDGGVEGPYALDLTRTVLDVSGGIIHKERGQPGRLSGQLRLDDGGATSDFHLELRNLGADGAWRTAPGFQLELAATPFGLAGWEAVIPALRGSAPAGSLAVPKLFYAADPQRLEGSVELRGVTVRAGARGEPIEVSGFLDATGTGVALRSASASAAGARLTLEGGVTGLFGRPEWRLRARTPVPVESNAVFSLVEALRDSVFGPLTLDVALRLPVSSKSLPPLERLRGEFRFAIGADGEGGQIRGVSMLQRVVEGFGSLGRLALGALPAGRGESLEEYYSEDFVEAAGAFRVADGWARTDDLRFVHDHYRTQLRGALRLEDLALDMRGEVVIGPELDAKLSGRAPGRERVIPLVRVGGELTDPTIALRDEDVSRFLAHYALTENPKLRRRIDDALGAGASERLRDVFEQMRR